jgi:hypothetical protein
VGERKKKEHARARSPRQAQGEGGARVNSLSKSGPILVGTRLPFADLFCHFESVTDFMRGIFGTHNRLNFLDAKNPSGSFLYIRTVPARNRTQRKTPTTPQPPCCAAADATSSRSSACTGDRESRSPEPRAQRSCTGRG